MNKSKYILIHKIIGATVMQAGQIIELTDDQAKHPFYRTRVRKADGAAELVPATPDAATGKAPSKGEVAKRLKELGIDFDGRKNAEELAALLPDGDPLKPTVA